jgi:preprotein translocase subunit YajC
MYYSLLVFAQAQGQEKQQPQGFPLEFPLLMMAVLFLAWMFLFRPARRAQQQERDALLKEMQKNDKVLTMAGIYGTIISVSDKEDEIVVKVDDNVRLKMTKGSILRNLTREEAAKAQKEAAKAAKEGAAS